MITKNLSTLKIHNLTQTQYERELAAKNVDEDALYLTPDDENYYTDTEIDALLADKADDTHNHDSAYDTKGAANTALASAKTYVDEIKNDLLNGAGSAYDTLKELGDLIDDNTDAIEALETIATGKANAVHTHTASEISNLTENLLDLTYPIGAIYLSVNNTSPASLFGGTWEQIKDRFLLAAGSTYSAGSTGGEAEHTLVYKELPETSGAIIMHNASYGTNIAGVAGCFTASYINEGTYRNGGGLLNADTTSVGKINYSNGGQGKAHNNMPPYLTVYIWKRVA